MNCKDCKHWQCANRLRGRTEYADCNHVVGELFPVLYKEPNYFKKGIYWETPFDPHDCKYFDKKLNDFLRKCKVPVGVRKDIKVEDDLIIDEFGGERIGKCRVVYFQTHKDYSCGKEN